MHHQPPSHWEAALAFLLIVGIVSVGYSTLQRWNNTRETVCFEFKTVEQMRLRQ
jgi:hypothetical protein